MVSTIGVTSYTSAGLAYAMLAVGLLLIGVRNSQNRAMQLAMLATVLWAAISALTLPYLPLFPIETVRNGCWFYFLFRLIRGGVAAEADRRWLKNLELSSYLLCAVMAAAQLLAHLDAALAEWLPLRVLGGAAGNIIQCVIALILLEQLFRNALAEQRWGVKFLCLGLAGLYVFDFYLYAEALLFSGIDRSAYEARGFVVALTAPLIWVSCQRNPGWKIGVTLSRRLMFQSATLLAAGLYLLLMAGVGYYIRYFGGSWGGVLQTVLLFAALISLLLALFSGTIRAYLKVFVSKHFFHYHYDYREEWLRFTRMLSEGEPGLHLRERAIRAIAELVESPGGQLWLRDDKDVFVHAARWNMPELDKVEPADGELCRFLESKQWVIDVDEYRQQQDRYAELAALPDWLVILPQAKLIVPLILHEKMLGFVILSRSRGNLALNWEVNDLLKTASRQAAGFLAQLEAAQALIVARQFESFNRMSAFVVHDLKNVVAQLSLMLKNAARHKDNPEFQEDMLETVGHAIDKMNRLLMQLRKGAQAIDKPDLVELGQVVVKAVEAKVGAQPQPEITANQPGVVVHADSERLERVVGHLVQNAVEATPPDGRVTVKLECAGKRARIEVCDTGRGMSAQFVRERLFKPFESTKSMGMGIGAYESREYIQQLGGDIEVTSEEGKGTTFVVTLPVASAA